MSINLPTKSSSRAGRFKKKLVPEESLEKEAHVIHDKMGPIAEMFCQDSLSAAEFSAIYLMTVLAYRFPGTWLGAKRSESLTETHHLNFPLQDLLPSFEPNIRKRLASFHTIGDLFQYFAFKSTPLTVNRSILNWSTNQYGLELMFRIPKPEEVLEQQKQGRRCVTIVLEAEKARKFILGQRDALGFTMHDLIHADHFYHNNQCYQGQLGFYGFLDFCLKENHFQEHLKVPGFEAEFEYLISDMNAYAVHLLKCFKSALIHYHDSGDDFFQDWLFKLDLEAKECEAFHKLNSSDYKNSMDEILLSLLSRYTAGRKRHLP